MGRFVDERADRATRNLYESVRAHPPTQRRGALLSATVYLAAAIVHLITAAFAIGGVLILVLPRHLPLVVRIVGALLLLTVAMFVFPRAGRRRVAPIRVGRAEAPIFFRLLDEAARELGAPTITYLEFSTVFNASYGRRGLKRDHVLGIGMALWAVLRPQEKLALVSHELGHAVNGDLRNTGLVWRALITLRRWQQLLTPVRHATSGMGRRRGSAEGWVSLVETLILPVVMFPLRILVAAFGVALEVFANRDGQRREYYADELAARVAGSDAAIRLTEKLLLGEFCSERLSWTVKFRRGEDPWRALHEAVDGVPENEWERLRRNARTTLGRIDSTHPPTQLRIDLLVDRPPREARIVLSEADASAIDGELSQTRAGLGESLRAAAGT